MNISDEKFVLCLKIVTFWGVSIVVIMVFLAVCEMIYPKIEYLQMPLKVIDPYLFFFSVFLSMCYYFCIRKKPQIVKYNRNEISYSAIFLDYYSLLLPSCIFFFSIASTVFTIAYFPDLYVSDFLMRLSILSLLLLIILLMYKTIFDLNTKNTLKMATCIYHNYLHENKSCRKNGIYINKFSYYFFKSINNIDRDLAKNLKVKDLQHESALPLKPLIKKYLNVYIIYSTQKELNDFKKNLDSMFNLCNNEDQVVRSEVTKYIIKVYVGIKDFLTRRNFKVKVGKISQYFSVNIPLNLLFLLTFFLILALIAHYSDISELYNTLNGYLGNQFGDISQKDRLKFAGYTLQLLYVLIILIGKIIDKV